VKLPIQKAIPGEDAGDLDVFAGTQKTTIGAYPRWAEWP
jgi:hypothetical protein